MVVALDREGSQLLHIHVQRVEHTVMKQECCTNIESTAEMREKFYKPPSLRYVPLSVVRVAAYVPICVLTQPGLHCMDKKQYSLLTKM